MDGEVPRHKMPAGSIIQVVQGKLTSQTESSAGAGTPVDVGLSVSRVGGSAQIKAMKKIAGKLRLDLAQFRELEAFAKFASDLDESTNEISESFDTKLGNDTKVSSRKFESFESKHPENDSSADRILKVSSGNFESSESKDCQDSEVSIGKIVRILKFR